MRNAAFTTSLIFGVLLVGHSTRALAQTTKPSGDAPGLVEFKSVEHGITFLYLSTWKPQAATEPHVVVRLRPADAPADGAGAPVAIVFVPPVKPREGNTPITFDDIQAAVIEEAIKGHAPDAKAVVSTDTTLGGQRARRVLMTGTDQRSNTAMKAVVLVTIHKGKGYAVTFAAPAEEFPRRLTGFDRLIESFRFMD